MSNYPTSPLETVGGMAYFARLLDKIRKHGRNELLPEYHANLGHQTKKFSNGATKPDGA